MKILLIKQSSLGDIVHSTLVIEAIKKQFPQAILYFMLDRQFQFILNSHPYITDFFFVDRKKMSPWKISFWKNFLYVRKELRQHYFDIVIDLQGIERSALFTYVARAKKKFIKHTKYPLLKGVRLKKTHHALDELRALLKLAGIEAKNSLPKLHINPKRQKDFLTNRCPKELKQVFLSKQKLVILNPFTTWQSKNIPIEKLYKVFLIMRKKDNDLNAVFIGPKQTDPFIHLYLEQLAKITFIHNLVGQTNIDDLLPIIDMGDFVLSGEGGVIHISNALRKDNCVIFGPTSPKLVGPWQKNSIVYQHPFPKKYMYKRHCPDELWDTLDCQKVAQLISEIENKNK